MESTLCEESVQEAGDDVLANYDKYLYEQYHVFFLDPRERPFIESDGQDFLKKYGGMSGFYGFSCDSLSVTGEKTAVDDKGIYLRYQISEYMKNRKAVDAGSALINLIKSSSDMQEKQGKGIADFEEKPEPREEVEKEKEQSPETARQRVLWSELKKTLTGIVHSGILLYAADDPGSISSLTIGKAGLPSKSYGKMDSDMESLSLSGLSLSKLSEWRTYLNSDVLSGMESIDLKEGAYLMDYLFECFSHYEDKPAKDKTALKYELEYIIAGRKTDQDNLRIVADRILMIRFLTNYAYASGDPAINGEAELMAAAVMGILGLPEGKEAVKTLLIAALSLGESVLELHAVMNGERVALVKNSSNWNISFSTAPGLLIQKSLLHPAKTGVGYEDYLRLFLAAGMKKNILIYRVMDIMQVNAGLEEAGFRMADALFFFEWDISCQCPRWFINLPGAGKGTDSFFRVDIHRRVSY